jgi:cytochrome c oxidase assembly factor CtaG/putative copper export protein
VSGTSSSTDLTDPAAAEPGRTGRDPWSVAGITVAAVPIGICVAVAVASIVPTRDTVTGIADSSKIVQLAVPALHALYDLMAAVTIGWLTASVFFVPPQRNGVLDAGGYRAIRAAALSACVWLASGLALVPVTVADQYPDVKGNPVSAEFLTKAIASDSTLQNMLWSCGFIAIVAVVAWSVLRPGWAALLMLFALVALLPQALGGHASSAGNHDVAVDTMLYHLVGITVWIGGLIAFLGLARQRVPFLTTIARRYSATALVAFIAVALSGIGNAWVRLTYVSDLWTTAYGRLIIVKALLLISLGVVGLAHRTRTLPALASGSRRPLIRLAIGEIVVMSATVGVAVGLSRTAPPPPSGVVPSQAELILGFGLPGPPTVWRLIVDWRFDWLLGTAAVVGAVIYLLAVRRLHRRGDRWPASRTIAWLLGCLLILAATSSGLGRYAQSQFSLHMIAHMIMGMGAPILLVLGGPTTLALRALPTAPRGGPPGAREMIVAVMNSRVVRFITHPLFVLPLFIGSFYAVYFTGLFELMMDNHTGHVLMNLHFLVVGYLYYWVIIGVDPAPRRWPHVVKLGLLLAALPFHAFFGLALMSSHEALAPDYYGSLDLPWMHDLVADQKLGGAIAWGVTEIPMLIVLIALLGQWARTEERQNIAIDRQKDTRGDTELVAYNAMLAGLAGRGGAAAATRPTDGSEVSEQPEEPEESTALPDEPAAAAPAPAPPAASGRLMRPVGSRSRRQRPDPS